MSQLHENRNFYTNVFSELKNDLWDLLILERDISQGLQGFSEQDKKASIERYRTLSLRIFGSIRADRTPGSSVDMLLK